MSRLDGAMMISRLDLLSFCLRVRSEGSRDFQAIRRADQADVRKMLSENRYKVSGSRHDAEHRLFDQGSHPEGFLLAVPISVLLDGTVIFSRHRLFIEEAYLGMVGAQDVVRNISMLDVPVASGERYAREPAVGVRLILAIGR